MFKFNCKMCAQKSKEMDEQLHNDIKEKVFNDNLPILWKYTDLDLSANRLILVILRIAQAVLLTS